jgi:phosphoglycerate dehydrogenase-like enzyme
MRIWTNSKFSTENVARLRVAIAPHELIVADTAHQSNLVAGGVDASCRTADIALGQPAPADVIASTSLKWLHLTSAGYTRYDRDDVRAALRVRGAMLTNSSSVYDDPCAQQVIAFMFAHNRRLLPAMLDQTSRRSWQYKALRPTVRILDRQCVLLVGFGAIARRLVALLAPFRADIHAIRRKVSGDELVPTFDQSKLEEQLGWADHVVNLLPSAPGNASIFNAARFTKMQNHAAFYNVGRGDTVDQNALVEALRNGAISGAYLDVTSPEPLPPDDPLWTAPNCMITPHVAGGMQNEETHLVEHFLENWRRFAGNTLLIDRVF